MRLKRRYLARRRDRDRRLARRDKEDLNHTDPGPPEDPNRKVLAATVALGHIFTVNDSTMGAAVKKHLGQRTWFNMVSKASIIAPGSYGNTAMYGSEALETSPICGIMTGRQRMATLWMSEFDPTEVHLYSAEASRFNDEGSSHICTETCIFLGSLIESLSLVSSMTMPMPDKLVASARQGFDYLTTEDIIQEAETLKLGRALRAMCHFKPGIIWEDFRTGLAPDLQIA
eukprot:Skav227654  [mRNA]  locus=scaffold58:523525:528448:- [translate_table: standard]